jgi:hypothetical protein
MSVRKINNTQTRTPEQQQVINNLTSRFDIDGERILFLNDKDPLDPWIPSSELEAIARQSGGIQSTDVEFYQFVEALQQIHYKATVITGDGRAYARTGAARLGEQSKGGEIDAETLAQGRALGNALRAAGFHPLKSGSVVPLDERRNLKPLTNEQIENHAIEDAAAMRVKDLKQIHAIAERKGLIVPDAKGSKNDAQYRGWLRRNFGVDTAVKLDAFQRAQVIAELENYLRDEEDELRKIA